MKNVDCDKDYDGCDQTNFVSATPPDTPRLPHSFMMQYDETPLLSAHKRLKTGYWNRGHSFVSNLYKGSKTVSDKLVRLT